MSAKRPRSVREASAKRPRSVREASAKRPQASASGVTRAVKGEPQRGNSTGRVSPRRSESVKLRVVLGGGGGTWWGVGAWDVGGWDVGGWVWVGECGWVGVGGWDVGGWGEGRWGAGGLDVGSTTQELHAQ